MRTYFYQANCKQTNDISLTYLPNLARAQYSAINVTPRNYWPWLKLVNQLSKNTQQTQTNLADFCTSIIMLRIRRLHKKAGTRHRKFTTTATTHWNLHAPALQTFLTHGVHFINHNKLNWRAYIFLRLNIQTAWNYQPPWAERRLLGLARVKKLLKSKPMLYAFSKYWYQLIYLFRITRDWFYNKAHFIKIYMCEYRVWRINKLPTNKMVYCKLHKQRRVHSNNARY